MNVSLAGKSVFCSWSGGKDSCLALYRAMRHGAKPANLLTMMREDGLRSRSHGLSRKALEQQAELMGIPGLFGSSTRDGYEAAFASILAELRTNGVTDGVFGDIDVEEHRAWVTRVCRNCGMNAHLPLWQEPRRSLVEEFIDAGFIATIVAVKKDKLDKRFLGLTLTLKTLVELEAAGVDAAGELGEYHTFVTDGPLFKQAVPFSAGRSVLRDGVWFLDIAVPG